MRSLKALKPGKTATISGVAFIAAVILIMTRPSESPEVRKEKAWSVESVPAIPTSVSPTLELFGIVQSPQNAELSAAIEAVVLELKVRDGASVKQDDVMLVLDDRDARLAVQQADADIKEARAQQRFAKIKLTRSKTTFDREQDLLRITTARKARAVEVHAEGLLSQSDLDTAEENFARQQIAVSDAELAVEENSARLTELEARIAKLSAVRDQAALDLDRTLIKAPFPGVISELQVSEGDRVRVGDMLMRLQNPASVEVRAQLPSRLAQTIKDFMLSGREIVATVETEGQQFSGLVRRVAGLTRQGSGGVDSFIGFEQAAGGLRLGSTVRVLMELPPEPNVIAVPGESVYGRNQIFKIDNQRMKMLEVERVGEREYTDGRTEVLIRSPELGPDDRIIITKLANATDGLLVQPISAVAPDLTDETRTADTRAPGMQR